MSKDNMQNYIFITTLILWMGCQNPNEGTNNVHYSAHKLRENTSKIKLDTVVHYFDRIEALDYECRSEDADNASVIDTAGYICKNIKKRVVLSDEIGNRFLKIINDAKTYKTRDVIACFEPHLALLFYKNDTIVAHSSICIGCQKINSSFLLPTHERYSCISREGAKGFSKLCAELGFSECSLIFIEKK